MNPTVYRLAFQTLAGFFAGITTWTEAAMKSIPIPVIVLGLAIAAYLPSAPRSMWGIE